MTRKHFVILICSFCCLSLVRSGQLRITQGKSGPRCGGGPRCLGNNQAECREGKCVCRHNRGIGHFVCPGKGERFCAIFNDPMVLSFDGSHAKVPLMMKFSGTSIMSKTCLTNNKDEVITTNGQCMIQIYGWGGRRLGKTFLKGFEVSVVVFIDGQAYFHATQITATAHNGVYKFTEGGNQMPWGGTQYMEPVETSIPNHGKIYTFYDQVDNFAVLKMDMCGVQVGIRGVEEEGDPLKVASGIYIKSKDGCDVTFPDSEKSVCISPPGKGKSLQAQLDDWSYDAERQVDANTMALMKILTSDVVQVFPLASSSLQVLADTSRECDVPNLANAVEMCRFVFEDPNYFRCYDSTADGTRGIDLIDSCIFSICDGSRKFCKKVKKTIINSKCPVDDVQSTILNFGCTF